jgi:hypothetical protein
MTTGLQLTISRHDLSSAPSLVNKSGKNNRTPELLLIIRFPPMNTNALNVQAFSLSEFGKRGLHIFLE